MNSRRRKISLVDQYLESDLLWKNLQAFLVSAFQKIVRSETYGDRLQMVHACCHKSVPDVFVLSADVRSADYDVVTDHFAVLLQKPKPKKEEEGQGEDRIQFICYHNHLDEDSQGTSGTMKILVPASSYEVQYKVHREDHPVFLEEGRILLEGEWEEQEVDRLSVLDRLDVLAQGMGLRPREVFLVFSCALYRMGEYSDEAPDDDCPPENAGHVWYPYQVTPFYAFVTDRFPYAQCPIDSIGSCSLKEEKSPSSVAFPSEEPWTEGGTKRKKLDVSPARLPVARAGPGPS